MNITIERQFPSGAWECYTIHKGYLVTRVYYGYTKREAMKLFRQYLKEN